MAHTTTAQEGIDPRAVRLVRHKARQLVRRPEFTATDRQDIEQELFLDLLTRLPRFDAARCKRSTFVHRVVNNRVAGLLQERSAQKRGGGLTLASLEDDAGGDDGPPEPRWATLDQRLCRRDAPSPREADNRRDLQIDTAAAIAGLPDDLRDLAESLALRNPSAVARERGVPRRTVRDRIAQIRARFERLGLRIYVSPTATSSANSVGHQ